MLGISQKWANIVKGDKTGEDPEDEDYKWLNRILDNEHPIKIIYNQLIVRKFEPPSNKIENAYNCTFFYEECTQCD